MNRLTLVRRTVIALSATAVLAACGGELSLPDVSATRSEATEATEPTETTDRVATTVATTLAPVSSVPASSVPPVTLPLDTVAPSTSPAPSTSVATDTPAAVDYVAGEVRTELVAPDGTASTLSFALGDGAELLPPTGTEGFVVFRGRVGEVPFTVGFLPMYGSGIDELVAADHDPAREVTTTHLLDGSLVGVVQELTGTDGVGRQLYGAAIVDDWSLQIALFPTPAALDAAGLSFEQLQRALASTIHTFSVAAI